MITDLGFTLDVSDNSSRHKSSQCLHLGKQHYWTTLSLLHRSNMSSMNTTLMTEKWPCLAFSPTGWPTTRPIKTVIREPRIKAEAYNISQIKGISRHILLLFYQQKTRSTKLLREGFYISARCSMHHMQYMFNGRAFRHTGRAEVLQYFL